MSGRDQLPATGDRATPGGTHSCNRASDPPLFWSLFLVGVAAILTLDLGVLNRKAHAVRPREAALWTLFCVTLAVAFGGWIAWRFGRVPALEFFTGYLIEYALSSTTCSSSW